MSHLFLQGKEIIEYYLRELETEGITQIPRWSPLFTATATAQIKDTIPISNISKEDQEEVHNIPTESLATHVEGRLTVHSILLIFDFYFDLNKDHHVFMFSFYLILNK